MLAVENLRKYYGLECKPVQVIEPYQMLGLVEADLREAMSIDVVGAWGKNNMFGNYNHEPLNEFKIFWGQTVLLPEGFNTGYDSNGDLLVYPEGDTSVAPSAKMPKSSYFFDAIIRQEPVDDETLDVQDSLE